MLWGKPSPSQALLLLALSSAASSLSTPSSPQLRMPSSLTSAGGRERSLFPFQEEGVARLVADRRLLLADDMGLGKTVQSIAALNHLFRSGEVSPTECRVLLICPKSLVPVWIDELERWIDHDCFSLSEGLHVVSAGATKPLDAESSRGMLQIINYDICHRFREVLREVAYDVLICDEAHYLKSVKSKRCDAILGVQEGGGGIESRYLWLLSGTPILNRPKEIYPLLWALGDSRRHTSYHKFEETWGRSFSELTNFRELRKLLRPLMLRRKKADVLSDLPPKVYSVVPLEGWEEVSQKEEKFAYEKFNVTLSAQRMTETSADSEECLGEFGDGSARARFGVGVKTLAMIRSFTSTLKIKPAAKLLREYLACEKVVVFAHHRKVILELQSEFGDSCVHIIGGMNVGDRMRAVRRFQNDASCRLFVGSIRAAGVGLTLTASSRVVFLDLDWSPGIMTQAEDRCHRVGQRDSVQVDYFVFKGTIDAWMARQLVLKSRGIRRTLAQSDRRSQMRKGSYKLNFGKYAGYEVDEIPFDYLNNFVIKEGVYQKKPALWNALYLSDIISEAPVNSGPDGDHVQNVAYTFDFGQYYGMEWSQVPQSYQDWVVKNKDIWKKRIGLWIALHEGGFVADEPELLDADDDIGSKYDQIEQVINADHGNNDDADNLLSQDKDAAAIKVMYTFDFGQYHGVEWSQVPKNYRDWVVATKTVWQKRKSLWFALHEGGLVAEEPVLLGDDNHEPVGPTNNGNLQINMGGGGKHVEYTFDFGKFNGRQWNDVDEAYRGWIIQSEAVWRKRKDLWVALHEAGLVNEDPY